jgi:methionyl-tRNA formyltransferase
VRIAVLYNRDVYALKALNRLLPGVTQHTLQLFHSSRVGRETSVQSAELVNLAVAEQSLLACFGARHPDEQRLGFDELSTHFGLSDAPLNNINQPAGLEALRRFNPDLMVSIRFGKILRDPAIACAPLGVINLHSGLLPHYRGVMPTFWAMLAGETQMGMTLHWVPDATIDTGATIATTAQPCDLQASYMSNVWHLYDAGVDLMLRAIAAIENGELKKDSAPGDSSGGQYFSFPGTSALTAFHEQGLQLYNSADQRLAGVR